ncbi:MAG TPA: efflux RND transporter periplasmic adaptor subunit [Prosthecobacter sp.]|nr:efflux RND transporter periplasmic adaptor subunit [Prosthecobacter sp.]
MRPLLVSLLLLAGAASAATVPGLILPLHDVELGTAVAGIVAEVLVKEGDTVEKGQPLLRLEDSVEKLEVDRAGKVLEKAKFDHEAAEKLLADKIATREAALTKRIEYDLARIQLDAAYVRLRQRTILAPLPAIVVKVDKEPGEAVLLNETVAQVIHIQEVYAQFYVEPVQASRLKTGTDFNFSVPSLPEPREFTGTVDFIDPRMDAESGLYRIKLRLPNPGLRLKAGMRAEAVFAQS